MCSEMLNKFLFHILPHTIGLGCILYSELMAIPEIPNEITVNSGLKA